MPLTEHNIEVVTSCIALFEQHTKPHILSVSVTVTITLLLISLAIVKTLSLFWLVALTSIIVLGLIEMVYAVRVGFDLSLLRHFAGHKGSVESRLSAIDNSLVKLRLMPSNKTGRSLDARLMGCMRMFKTQLALCALQLISVVGATVLQLMLTNSITT